MSAPSASPAGVLPVPNDEALRLPVLTGFLLNWRNPPLRQVHRKLFLSRHPKNYQITQYDQAVHGNATLS